MRICDRCHCKDKSLDTYTASLMKQQMNEVSWPSFRIANLDLCLNCTSELREVIQKFLKPITVIEVKHADEQGIANNINLPGSNNISVPLTLG